ncbi:MAG: hypothetical protein A3D96_05105 [Chlamydiae bacterium RIFCSPHIGHO2_12_FULL_44_59]|nr:MAG: hypothetical protein A2796_03230 [Chlamydiae bacterium RIFCSPHIGHO2_01_FULL_44_39]OGN60196.1 MAG: hypothetical protein A3D96_05105 [Chlamydiae bacterium RIFCSPHIGHO2_12_FULL_44_59]OGN67151.1 MAG: hypothetical protein A2978_00935 [Chlamydiae bacterium RIFCSPLOWO2_01_FULL_44_52]OGN67741.1 MAG: hypothetical protein A3I67_04870 [Chlamydiae bacterium RIFCSPLOWO2_02_FULL_45_22]OGN71444.1 MAG: hypothetical protein A3F79_03535 [Chlamydiae bacterium RIFCSPLOWO2_12_FULL_45_20]
MKIFNYFSYYYISKEIIKNSLVKAEDRHAIQQKNTDVIRETAKRIFDHFGWAYELSWNRPSTWFQVWIIPSRRFRVKRAIQLAVQNFVEGSLSPLPKLPPFSLVLASSISTDDPKEVLKKKLTDWASPIDGLGLFILRLIPQDHHSIECFENGNQTDFKVTYTKKYVGKIGKFGEEGWKPLETATFTCKDVIGSINWSDRSVSFQAFLTVQTKIGLGFLKLPLSANLQRIQIVDDKIIRITLPVAVGPKQTVDWTPKQFFDSFGNLVWK